MTHGIPEPMPDNSDWPFSWLHLMDFDTAFMIVQVEIRCRQDWKSVINDERVVKWMKANSVRINATPKMYDQHVRAWRRYMLNAMQDQIINDLWNKRGMP